MYAGNVAALEEESCLFLKPAEFNSSWYIVSCFVLIFMFTLGPEVI